MPVDDPERVAQWRKAAVERLNINIAFMSSLPYTKILKYMDKIDYLEHQINIEAMEEEMRNQGGPYPQSLPSPYQPMPPYPFHVFNHYGFKNQPNPNMWQPGAEQSFNPQYLPTNSSHDQEMYRPNVSGFGNDFNPYQYDIYQNEPPRFGPMPGHYQYFPTCPHDPNFTQPGAPNYGPTWQPSQDPAYIPFGLPNNGGIGVTSSHIDYPDEYEIEEGYEQCPCQAQFAQHIPQMNTFKINVMVPM